MRDEFNLLDTKSEVYIYYVDMPYSVASNSVQNPDGSYTVYINSRMTRERNIKGYMHELSHIVNNHLDNYCDVQIIENQVRGK